MKSDSLKSLEPTESQLWTLRKRILSFLKRILFCFNLWLFSEPAWVMHPLCMEEPKARRVHWHWSTESCEPLTWVLGPSQGPLWTVSTPHCSALPLCRPETLFLQPSFSLRETCAWFKANMDPSGSCLLLFLLGISFIYFFLHSPIIFCLYLFPLRSIYLCSSTEARRGCAQPQHL